MTVLGSELTRKRSRWAERLFIVVCLLAVMIPLSMLGVLLVDVALDGAAKFHVNIGNWQILPGALRAIMVLGVAVVVCLPVGILLAKISAPQHKTSATSSAYLRIMVGFATLVAFYVSRNIFIAGLALGLGSVAVAKKNYLNSKSLLKTLQGIATPLALSVAFFLVGCIVLDGLAQGELGRFLTAYPSARAARAGIWPALLGSLYVIGLTAIIALPVGVGAAVYLEEYGRRNRFFGFLEVNIANLAGVPSIIYGLLGLEVFVRFLGMGRSIIAAACTLALLVLPIIITATREALRTIPPGMREGCLALGATRWQTTKQVVLPMALPGILTGAILAVSRALGETAPIIVIGAAVFINFTPTGLSSEFTTLPIQIFNWASMPQRDFLVNAAAGIVVLVATLLFLNSIAIVVRDRTQKRN